MTLRIRKCKKKTVVRNYNVQTNVILISLLLTSATHLGHLQSPRGTEANGGIKQ